MIDTQSTTRLRALVAAAAATARPSRRAVIAARHRAADAAWNARMAGDWHAYREIMRRLAELRARTDRRTLRERRNRAAEAAWEARLAGNLPAYRQHMRRLEALRQVRHWGPTTLQARRERRQVRDSSPAELIREAEQRAAHDAQQARVRAAASPEAHARQLARWRAQAVCEALWAVHHGHRDWEHIPTRPCIMQARVSEGQTTGSVATPQRLVVRVPALPPLGIAEHEVRLYRAEYEGLMLEWGVTQLRKLRTLRSRVQAKLRAQTDSRELAELVEMAETGQVAQPARALPWADFLDSPRLSVVFAYQPERRDVRLAPRKGGDLRECLMELAALLELEP